MAFLFLGPNRLASPRVNGYLVKASSNPFTFYDSPLPGVNTPWDVMRIVCNPELMDVAEVVQFPTGRYVVPTGRVIATVSIKVPTGRYIVPAGYIVPTGRTSTDISEITRKPSKTSKHEHENGRVYKSRKPKKVKSTVNSSQSWSTKVNKTQNVSK
ncbi:hypothetical protein Tco_0735560 [Tanacetum coccineum]